jgi:hypothetical protein
VTCFLIMKCEDEAKIHEKVCTPPKNPSAMQGNLFHGNLLNPVVCACPAELSPEQLLEAVLAEQRNNVSRPCSWGRRIKL